jgi:hypothetical protein
MVSRVANYIAGRLKATSETGPLRIARGKIQKKSCPGSGQLFIYPFNPGRFLKKLLDSILELAYR